MKTLIEMAIEAGLIDFRDPLSAEYTKAVIEDLTAFAELVRAEEREKFFTPEEARIALEDTDFTWHNSVTQAMTDKLIAIRNRSNT